jgi:hypothetical protein
MTAELPPEYRRVTFRAMRMSSWRAKPGKLDEYTRYVRDASAQLRGLSEALTAAGVRLQPDSAKRKQQSDYSSTLRDRVGATVAALVSRLAGC